jgi:hypothetical protein
MTTANLGVQHASISADRLTAEELASLAPIELGALLNEISVASLELSKLAIQARKMLGQAKIRVLGNKNDYAAQSALELARVDVDVLNIRARDLRGLRSTVQSLLRAASV